MQAKTRADKPKNPQNPERGLGPASRWWNWVQNDDDSRTLYLDGPIAEESFGGFPCLGISFCRMEFVTACLLKIIPSDTSKSAGDDSSSINRMPSAKPSSTAFLALNQLSASMRCDIFARESPVFSS